MNAHALKSDHGFRQEASAMRLLRVRFGVGTLLCVVAVAAANFAVLRPFLESSDGNGVTEGSIILVGFLPLINAAVIGSLRFGATKIRPLLGDPASSARMAPAAFTFFNLHFLALGGLVALLVPDALNNYMLMPDVIDDYLRRFVDYLASGLENVLNITAYHGGVVADLVVGVPIVGILISAPPLLCAWIGAALARRYIAVVPLWRFRAMAGLVSFGFATVALSVAIAPRPFEGNVDVVTDFQVVDRDSGRPIPGALVGISDAFLSPWPLSVMASASTDTNGRTRLRHRLTANGQSNAFGITGLFSTWGRWLIVSAPGHPTIRKPLPEAIGPLGEIGHSSFGQIAVVQRNGPQEPFREIAGIYSRQEGMGGTGFNLLPDGHFTWSSGGCGSHYLEYGTFTRVGDVVRFIAVPRPGEETHFLIQSDYNIISWGHRTYLVLAEDKNLMGLCQDAVLPRSSTWYSGFIYPRQSDEDRPKFGLPTLPLRVWLRFFIREMASLIQRDQSGEFRRSIGRLANSQRGV